MSEFTHAGGIVFRSDDGVCRYLIVSAKKNPNHWVFPKGHIGSEETPKVAAVREVLEETGIEAKIVNSAGSIRFHTNQEDVAVNYYLMEYIGKRGKGEKRQKRWHTFEEALDLLTFSDSQALLRNVQPLVAELR